MTKGKQVIGTREAIEEVARKVSTMLGEAMVAAMDEVGEAGTVEVGTKVGSRQQQKGHLESAEGRRYRKLEGQIRKARAAMRQVRGATQDDLDAATPMAVREYGAL